MEGMERAKLPIADYTEVKKEENGRNGKSKVTYSRLHKGIQGKEWKEWTEQNYLWQTTEGYTRKRMEGMYRPKLPIADYIEVYK